MEKSLKKSFAIIGAFAITVLLAFTICGCAKKSSSNSSSNSNSSSSSKFSADNFKQTDQVEIEVANYGKIKVGLDANAAPITVANFKKLVGDGFYNGLTFHRIVKDFCLQGGDPKGDGSGGSDKTIKGEFTENGVNNHLAHTRGAISMARSNDKDSASSQFFIVPQTSSNNSTSLDGKYACFGYVQEGMEVVDKIMQDFATTDSSGKVPSAQQPKITSIKLL